MSNFPFLTKILEEKLICYLSSYFAKYFAKDESTAVFLAYLFEASKMGHLCVKIDQGIHPFPSAWEAIDGLFKDELIGKVIDGANKLKLSPLPVVCMQGNLYYLQRNWFYESQILEHFKRLNSIDSKTLFKQALLDEKLFDYSQKNLCLTEQIEAIRCAASSSVSFILGGPGTGKTYTACHLVEALNYANPKVRIVVAAPTGKASIHLKEKIFQKSGLKVDAKTLHSLLGLRRGSSNLFKEKLLPYDVVLIDESSMIDVRVMYHLLKSIKESSRLVMMGDPDQLPPIESGNIFYDLSSISSSSTKLEKPMRFESKHLDLFAQSLNLQKMNQIVSILQDPKVDSIQHIAIEENSRRFYLDLEKKIDSFFTSFSQKRNPETYLTMLNSFRLLSSIRTGYYGVDELNKWCYEQVKLRAKSTFAVPILITSNHHVKQLYNGMVGVLVRERIAGRTEEMAYFPAEDGGIKRISKIQLPPFEYGFCLSVHKSQGSEFDHAILFMPKGSEVFGKEILYTAATRAKKSLQIIGSLDILKETMRRSSLKLSGINDRR